MLDLEITAQVNYCRDGDYFDTLDDFFGAVNIATLKIGVAGEASFDNKLNRDVFNVHQLAFYIRDTYDFNDGSPSKLLKILNLTNTGKEFPGLGARSKSRTLDKKNLSYIIVMAGMGLKIFRGLIMKYYQNLLQSIPQFIMRILERGRRH
jgi:hypothetical protein